MKRKVVYIAHPIAGDIEGNLKSLRQIVRQLTMEGTVIPFVPYYVYVASLDDLNPDERQKAMEMNLQLIALADEVWLMGSKVSGGMQQEASLAEALRIPVIDKTIKTI